MGGNPSGVRQRLLDLRRPLSTVRRNHIYVSHTARHESQLPFNSVGIMQAEKNNVQTYVNLGNNIGA